MKGKIKTLLSMLIFLAVIVTAGILVSLNNKTKELATYAVGSGNNEFSFVDSQNIILSVEKVGVSANGDFSTPLTNTSGQSLQTMKVRDASNASGVDYYYTNLPNGSTNPNKYVVNENEFVMLNNNLYNSNGYYYSSSISASALVDGGNVSVDMAEGLLVSLGNYYYVNGEVLKADTEGAGITYIDAVVYRNGVRIASPSPREFDNNRYEDWAFIILQDGNDGYYEFVFQYRYNDILYTKSFGFYVIYGTSYYSTVKDGNGNDYNIQPTLTATNNGSGYEYYLGAKEAGNYPTITYDYTKYQLSYTHKANGVTTSYNYVYNTSSASLNELVCYVNNGEQTNTYSLGTKRNDANIAVVAFTEMGEYEFNFKYLYTGYNSNSAPEMNLNMFSQRLQIYGFELKYSKANYSEAQMRYITFANSINASTANVNVGLIVPNGYMLNTNPAGRTLGVVYDYNSASSLKVGSVVRTEEANRANIINLLDASENKIDFANLKSYKAVYPSSENIEEINKLNFTKTNQGSLWLSSSNTYDAENSFYYFSSSKENLIMQKVQITSLLDFNNNSDLYIKQVYDADNSYEYLPATYYNPDMDYYKSNATRYSNTTSFNNVGYYLAFIKVDIADKSYYQVFAFQYTPDTTDVKVFEADDSGNATDVPVGAGKYTNKNVVVSWAEPGVFERTITAKYYSVPGSYLSQSALLTTTGTPIQSGVMLGENVADRTGSTFLIELKREGITSVYRTFTIDREAISGVSVYLVERGSNLVGNTIYRFATNQDNNYVNLNTGITNGLATLYWSPKNSGASIQASYTFTPFIRDTSIKVGEVVTDEWFSTNYKLGTTIGSFEISKADNLGANLDFSKVLFDQGIYVFTITDAAGNSCKYMFIIDRTESYFKVITNEAEGGQEFVTNDFKLYTNNVSVQIGTNKVLSLSRDNSNEMANDMFNIISLAGATSSGASYNDINYYTEVGSNYSALNNLFARTLNSGVYNYYLTVKNLSVSTYNDTQNYVPNQSIGNISSDNRTIPINKGASSSVVRVLYLLGQNQTNVSATNSNSFVSIEINTDHARGMAYYANSLNELDIVNIPTNGGNGNSIYRLHYTGSAGSEFAGTHATGDDYLAFVWNTGVGTEYEVESVCYDYYLLDLTSSQFSNNYYYVKNSSYTLFNDGVYQGATIASADGSRARAILNIANAQTTAGLYVVTRTYKNAVASGDSDNQILTYYYIVDRNGIIDVTEKINGGFISLGLLDNNTEFNGFNSVGVTKGELYYTENNQTITIPYNIYLTTDKLPAVLNIPVGKYFDGKNGSEYYAGKLNFTVYFKDNARDRQVRSQNGLETYYNIKLFSSTVEVNQSGYYVLDLLNSTSMNDALKAVFVNAEGSKRNDTSWLCLPGDYVIVITDNVEGSNKHQKVIGFRIEATTPTTDVYSVAKLENEASTVANTSKADAEFNLTTSEEFIKIELFNTDDNKKAQIDVDYLVVDQTLNGVTNRYINYQHGVVGGMHNINNPSDEAVYQINYAADGVTALSRTLLLNTYLRSSNGMVDLNNINNTLTYTITIRYFVSSSDDLDKYANCYYMFNSRGEKVYYYYNTYTVNIDRIPPENNVANLLAEDSLVNEYINENGEEMFENYVYDYLHDETVADGVYFTKRYKSYYATKHLASAKNDKIYAFYITRETSFDATDVESVYYNLIALPKSAGLNLPVTILSNYIPVGVMPNNYSFLTAGNFYEILEVDKAGNTTQYVVYCGDGQNDENLNITLNATLYDHGIGEDSIEFSINGSSNNIYTIFNISCGDSSSVTGVDPVDDGRYKYYPDLFYRIELFNTATNQVQFIHTNFATNFDATITGLAQDVANLIKNAGVGVYGLTLRSRLKSYSYTINYYDEVHSLSIENLVKQDNNGYYIDLAGANEIDLEKQITYYATQITITQGSIYNTFVCNPNNGFTYTYLNGNNENWLTIVGNRLYGLSGSYKITMVDAFNQSYTYRFNTNGEEFYSINFGLDGNSSYHLYDGTYYSYNQANIKYDTSLLSYYISYTLTENGSVKDSITASSQTVFKDASGVELISVENGVIKINPYFLQTNNSLGATLSVTVQFLYGGVNDAVYHVVVDSYTGSVALRDTDNADKTNRNVAVDINADYLLTTPAEPTSGTMNLSWNKPVNDYFNYTYTLYEKMEDGSFITTVLNNATNVVINTQSGSTGVYKFVVGVYTINGSYLGNKVYSFSVQAITNDIYYVINNNGYAVSPNSSFKFSEFDPVLGNQSILISNRLGVSYNSLVNISYEIPLYITNEDLSLVPAEDIGVKTTDPWSMQYAGGAYTFYLYRVYTNTYNLYLAILKVNPTSEIVTNVAINATELDSTASLLDTNNALSYTYNDVNGVYSLMASQKFANNFNNVITRKNSVVLEIWYNDSYMADYNTNNNGEAFKYVIAGNGKYTFKFKDMAGNVHMFTTSSASVNVTRPELDITILREVVVNVNGTAVVNNAYYNGEVVVSVYNPSIYDLGTISLTATLNGNYYQPEKTLYNYTFKGYGTYRVQVNATHNGVQLKKVIVFTIINEKEARQSFDLTSISNYNITKITNNAGEDITNNLLTILNSNNKTNLLSYNLLLEYAGELNTSSGKQTITISYEVEDNVYPTRKIDLKIMLNNVVPTIESSLKAGDSTTKGFTISFNAGIIYNQIGESAIYINDILVCEINEYSPLSIQSFEVSEKEYGSGDYYVMLKTSSGAIVPGTSFKVTIKEPLNTASIIIIVVVSAIVIGVIVLIIVLRTRMRIR